MQLTIFTYLGKINPREKYLLACDSSEGAIEQCQDYLDYSQLSVNIALKGSTEINKLAKELHPANSKCDNNIKKAFQLFIAYDTRIFLEGVIFSFGVDVAAEFFELDIDVLKTYCDVFFNIVDFKGIADKNCFYDYIGILEIQEWFRRVDKFTIADLEYTVKGKPRKRHKTAIILESMVQSLYNDFEAMRKSSDYALKNESKDQLKRFGISIKLTEAITNIARVQLQYDDILNKNSKSFMQEWNAILKTKQSSRFKSPEDEETELSIKDQINKISPISSAPTESTPEQKK
jgi:hypothetical protein